VALGLWRSPRHRLVGGVAGGLGERLGVDPVLARAMFAALAVAGGMGFLAYLVLWAVVPEDDGRALVKEPGNRRGLAVGMVVAGVTLLLHEAGFWFGEAAAWSVGLATVGMAIIWARSDVADRAAWNRLAGRVAENPLEVVLSGRAGKMRLVAGVCLVGAGLAIFIAATDAFARAGSVIAGALATAAGLGLLLGPWIYRLVGQLGEERRARIRSQERSEMAAHLHDSVLQTLALIQRSDEPREMVALARSQERELRAWLNDGTRRNEGSLGAAIEEAASEVELQFKVPVEVVTVGDAPLDERLRAMVDACREATINAAKHSGAERVSVYLEVEPEVITAFVRDQGSGFDLPSIASDRRGISESIRGRMERVAGSALITTEPGNGTEVQLTVPRLTVGRGAQ
jgi:signal transduction histidine kinase